MLRRYFVVFIGIILLVIFVVFIFRGGSDTPKKIETEKTPLHDYANSETTAVLTTQGRVVGDDKFRSVRITVGRDFRKIEILAGYNEVVEKTQTFSNNQAGYETFLRALELNGFSRSRKATISDERGVCSTGNRFIYELIDGGDQKQRTWSTSCNSAQGTFAGQQIIRQLFQAQITDYGKFISGVPLL